MSLSRYVTVFCDTPECSLWAGQEETAAAARRVAKRAGWTRRDGRDYCPKHSEGDPR